MQRSPVDTLNAFSWDDVRLFLALYRSPTMGAAARTLRVNASTVSRRLLALEEALDATLFERGRDGLSPTQAAEDLLLAAEMTEQSVAAFANAADALERTVSGLVRIACPPDMAEVIVLPMLRPLFAAHPELRVSLSPGEAVVDLLRREADIALRIVRPTRGDLICRRVLTVTWRPARSPDLDVDATDLDAVPWVGLGPSFATMPPSRWLAAHVDAEPVLQTDSLTTQIAAVQEGLGVALVPSPSFARYGLVPLADDGDLPPLLSNDVFLITHRSLRSVPRIRVVWEALVAALTAL